MFEWLVGRVTHTLKYLILSWRTLMKRATSFPPKFATRLADLISLLRWIRLKCLHKARVEWRPCPNLIFPWIKDVKLLKQETPSLWHTLGCFSAQIQFYWVQLGVFLFHKISLTIISNVFTSRISILPQNLKLLTDRLLARLEPVSYMFSFVLLEIMRYIRYAVNHPRSSLFVISELCMESNCEK